jgi:hypothetical protein
MAKRNISQKTILIGVGILVVIAIAAYVFSPGGQKNTMQIQQKLQIVSVARSYGQPGWINCYGGNINYFSINISNNGNTPATVGQDFTFCQDAPSINATLKSCLKPFGICPSSFSLQSNVLPWIDAHSSYDFGLLPGSDYVNQNSVCGKTFNVYLISLPDYQTIDHTSLTVSC